MEAPFNPLRHMDAGVFHPALLRGSMQQWAFFVYLGGKVGGPPPLNGVSAQS